MRFYPKRYIQEKYNDLLYWPLFIIPLNLYRIGANVEISFAASRLYGLIRAPRIRFNAQKHNDPQRRHFGYKI